MEFYEKEYLNGILILPESTVDGIYEKIDVKFKDFDEIFPVEKLEILQCSCAMELIPLLEKVLSLSEEQLWDGFLKYAGGIMIACEAYRVRFHEFSFSKGIPKSGDLEEFVYAFEDMKFVMKQKKFKVSPQTYLLSYTDLKEEKEVEKEIVGLFENKDSFENYVYSITNLWQSLVRSRENTIVKMRFLGILR